MNKIITINIGGLAINIEEDAYDVLRRYLQAVSDHFSKMENGKEIYEDIEHRIAEMLHERLRPGKAAIDVQDIDDVKERMGQPGEFEDEDQEEDVHTGSTASDSARSTRHRRLYRDPDNSLLGGVCAGLANYLGVDVVIVRIIWVLFFFLFGTSLLLYFILWVIVPQANTTTEKLEMMGEEPTIDNIGKKIREEANAAMESIRRTARNEEFKNSIRKGGRLLEGAGKAIARAAAGIVSFLLVILLIVLTGRILFGIDNILIRFPNFSRESLSLMFQSPVAFWVLIGSFYAAIVIPLILILSVLIRFIFNLERDRSGVNTVLRWTWVLSLVVLVSLGAYTMAAFSSQTTTQNDVKLSQTDTLWVGMEEFSGKYYPSDKRTRLVIRQSESNEMYMTVAKTSNGFNKEEAEDLIDELIQSYSYSNGVLHFSEYPHIRSGGKFRNQSIRYTLYVPVGTILKMGEQTNKILTSYVGADQLTVNDMPGNTFRMTREGLVCISCKGRKARYRSSSLPKQRFDVIAVHNAFDVTIEEGDIDEVRIEGPSEQVDEVSAIINNGVLNIKYTGNSWDKFNRLMQDEPIRIYITARNVRRFESNGAGRFTINGMRTDNEMFISLRGAAIVKAKGVYADQLHIDMEGASSMDVEGSCKELFASVDGANKLTAGDLTTEEVHLDVEGASYCEFFAEESIDGSVEGAASITYYGNPRIQADLQGLVNLQKKD